MAHTNPLYALTPAKIFASSNFNKNHLPNLQKAGKITQSDIFILRNIMTDTAPEFRITLSGQITPQDVDELAKMGVKTIVNNRPDGEEAGQPTSAEIEQACQAHNIAYKHIAFAGGMMDMNHVQDFADFFNSTERPLHLFCRTGNRSNTLLTAARERDLLDED